MFKSRGGGNASSWRKPDFGDDEARETDEDLLNSVTFSTKNDFEKLADESDMYMFSPEWMSQQSKGAPTRFDDPSLPKSIKFNRKQLLDFYKPTVGIPTSLNAFPVITSEESLEPMGLLPIDVREEQALKYYANRGRIERRSASGELISLGTGVPQSPNANGFAPMSPYSTRGGSVRGRGRGGMVMASGRGREGLGRSWDNLGIERSRSDFTMDRRSAIRRDKETFGSLVDEKDYDEGLSMSDLASASASFSTSPLGSGFSGPNFGRNRESDRDASDETPSSSEPSSETPTNSSWLYKDPLGNIQGPFSDAEMTEWYDAGYFSDPTLQVKRVGQSQFTPLEKVLQQRTNNNASPFSQPLVMTATSHPIEKKASSPVESSPAVVGRNEVTPAREKEHKRVEEKPMKANEPMSVAPQVAASHLRSSGEGVRANTMSQPMKTASPQPSASPIMNPSQNVGLGNSREELPRGNAWVTNPNMQPQHPYPQANFFPMGSVPQNAQPSTPADHAQNLRRKEGIFVIDASGNMVMVPSESNSAVPGPNVPGRIPEPHQNAPAAYGPGQNQSVQQQRYSSAWSVPPSHLMMQQQQQIQQQQMQQQQLQQQQLQQQQLQQQQLQQQQIQQQLQQQQMQHFAQMSMMNQHQQNMQYAAANQNAWNRGNSVAPGHMHPHDPSMYPAMHHPNVGHPHGAIYPGHMVPHLPPGPSMDEARHLNPVTPHPSMNEMPQEHKQAPVPAPTDSSDSAISEPSRLSANQGNRPSGSEYESFWEVTGASNETPSAIHDPVSFPALSGVAAVPAANSPSAASLKRQKKKAAKEAANSVKPQADDDKSGLPPPQYWNPNKDAVPSLRQIQQQEEMMRQKSPEPVPTPVSVPTPKDKPVWGNKPSPVSSSSELSLREIQEQEKITATRKREAEMEEVARHAAAQPKTAKKSGWGSVNTAWSSDASNRGLSLKEIQEQELREKLAVQENYREPAPQTTGEPSLLWNRSFEAAQAPSMSSIMQEQSKGAPQSSTPQGTPKKKAQVQSPPPVEQPKPAAQTQTPKKKASAAPTSVWGSAPAKAAPLSQSNESDEGAFWELPADSKPKATAASKLTQEPLKNSEDDFPTLAPKATGPSQAELIAWATKQLKPLAGARDKILAEKLVTLKTNTEIQNFAKTNLGTGEASNKFVESYLAKKNSTTPVQSTPSKSSSANVAAPKPAEPAATGKKKGGKKGTKIDPTMLGWSVSSSRPNQGEIHSIDDA